MEWLLDEGGQEKVRSYSKFFAVRLWNKFPKDDVGAPYLEGFKARLNGAE